MKCGFCACAITFQTQSRFRPRTAAAYKQSFFVCGELGVAFSVSQLRAQEKKPFQLYLSLIALTVCKRAVTVNTAPLWLLQDCIKSPCVCLQCYFRHVSAFVRQSLGKLFTCSLCSDSCHDIVRSLQVGCCINAGAWELRFVQFVAKRNVKTAFWYSFSVWSAALRKHKPSLLFFVRALCIGLCIYNPLVHFILTH